MNRRVLLDLPAEERERRLLSALAEAGVATQGIPAFRLWEVVAPRIRRFADAGTFLRFLGPEFEPPFVPEADRPQLDRVRAELSAAGPVSTGSDLAERLDALATHPAEVHDLRRVLRWALTGQPIGPPVWRVWDLLGPEEAHRRLGIVGLCENP